MSKGFKIIFSLIVVFVVIFLLIYLIFPISNINFNASSGDLVNKYFLSSNNEIGLRFSSNDHGDRYIYLENKSEKEEFTYQISDGLLVIDDSIYYVINKDNSLRDIGNRYYLFYRG